ncbi:MAG: hypothetical protein ACRENB_01645 [Gemmatimonadales bacterium]
MNTRILVVAHESALGGLQSLIEAEPDFEVAAACSEWWRGIATLGETEVDLCILDVSRPGMDAELVIRRFKQQHPFLKIIALVDDRDYPRLRLVDSGVVADHVVKNRIAQDLVGTVRRSLGGLSLARRRWVGKLVGSSTAGLLAATGPVD